MKVFISSDIEGTAGIVDWGQVLMGSHEYELGRMLLEGEVNAAIAGAIDAGATAVVVNDAHHTMQNLRPHNLVGRASLVSGFHKRLYMMEVLDGSFGCALLVSYHGSISAEHATLSHTYNPQAIWHAALNGAVVGESTINMLVAAHYGVPVVLVTGDQITGEEARRFSPGIEVVVVKRSIPRFESESVHPEKARERIPRGRPPRRRARGDGGGADDRAARPARPHAAHGRPGGDGHLDPRRRTQRRARRPDRRRRPLRLYRTFVTVLALTRSIVEPR